MACEACQVGSTINMTRYASNVKLSVAAKVYGKRFDEVKGALKAGCLSAAQWGVTDIQARVIPQTFVLQIDGSNRRYPPVDRGTFKAGWRAKATRDGAVIYHIQPMLAAIIEEGVRPGNVKIGKAMIRALTGWAKRKRLSGNKENSKQIAWAIAKSMQKYGMAPRHVLARAKPHIMQFAPDEIKRFVMRKLRGEL